MADSKDPEISAIRDNMVLDDLLSQQSKNALGQQLFNVVILCGEIR